MAFSDTNESSSYKCPACGAPLIFSAEKGNLICEYCDSEFDIDTVKIYNDTLDEAEQLPDDELASYDTNGKEEWNIDGMTALKCSSCGAEVIADVTTASTKCPFCDNNMVIGRSLNGQYKPDLIIPFKKTKNDAVSALHKFYGKKWYLPKDFRDDNRLEEVKGVYVPYWLYDTGASGDYTYNATKVTHWSDSKYEYTKTNYYLVERSGRMNFDMIPADGSSKADDTYMESIEPYSYNEIRAFDSAYLAGYLADRYDVTSEDMKPRIQQRVRSSVDNTLRSTINGYTTVNTRSSHLSYYNTKINYGLLPVWMLSSKYNGEIYQFAMNGQTGKFVGKMPFDKGKRTLTILLSGLIGFAAAVVVAAGVLGV